MSAISTAIFKSDFVIIAAQVKVFTKKALLTMIISASCLTTVTLSEGKNITHLLFHIYHRWFLALFLGTIPLSDIIF